MSVDVTWETLDWGALDLLRETFLNETPTGNSYWSSRSDLVNYDFTYGQRIGWKWDAVLRELQLRGWLPPPGEVLDWGCGSGIAGRRVLEFFGSAKLTMLRVFDRSTLAMDFAVESARAAFPNLEVERADRFWRENKTPGGTLVLSHVLNELTEIDREALRRIIGRAAAVLWVEPGTHSISRDLIAWREALLGQFSVVAPCTHAASCGMLAAENQRHWCHHFAAPPPGIMGDSNWVRFAQRAGIDLRSLPYSFLAMERKSIHVGNHADLPEGCSRVIGVPRIYKGFAKVFSCRADGVREFRLQQRVAPELFRALKTGNAGPIHRWRVSGDDIQPDTSVS